MQHEIVVKCDSNALCWSKSSSMTPECAMQRVSVCAGVEEVFNKVLCCRFFLSQRAEQLQSFMCRVSQLVCQNGFNWLSCIPCQVSCAAGCAVLCCAAVLGFILHCAMSSHKDVNGKGCLGVVPPPKTLYQLCIASACRRAVRVCAVLSPHKIAHTKAHPCSSATLQVPHHPARLSYTAAWRYIHRPFYQSTWAHFFASWLLGTLLHCLKGLHCKTPLCKAGSGCRSGAVQDVAACICCGVRLLPGPSMPPHTGDQVHPGALLQWAAEWNHRL